MTPRSEAEGERQSRGGHDEETNQVNAHQNIQEQTERLSIPSRQKPAQSMKLDFKSSLLIEQYWMGFLKALWVAEGEKDWEIMTTYALAQARRN